MTTAEGRVVRAGEIISIDGSTGAVYAGPVPVEPSAVVKYFDARIDAAFDHADDATRGTCSGGRPHHASHADATRRLAVRANADTVEDAARARRMGAGGIGLSHGAHVPG